MSSPHRINCGMLSSFAGYSSSLPYNERRDRDLEMVYRWNVVLVMCSKGLQLSS